MQVLFLKAREYKSKAGTPLVEVFLLDVETHKLIAHTLEASALPVLGFQEPSGTDLIALSVVNDGFRVKIEGAKYTGQTVEYVIND